MIRLNSFDSDEQRRAFFANFNKNRKIGKSQLQRKGEIKTTTIRPGRGIGTTMLIDGYAPISDNEIKKMKLQKSSINLGSGHTEITDEKNREHYTARTSTLNGREVLEPKFHPVGKKTKKFENAKAMAIKYLEKEIERLGGRHPSLTNSTNEDIKKILKLDGYPTDSRQLRGVDTAAKAKLLKAQLEDEFPDSKWSVQIERYSGGSSIKAKFLDGKYPYGAEKIGDLYSNSGDTDIQSDYFDVDNYVSVFDGRHSGVEPQTIANSPIDRLAYKIQVEMDKDYTKYSKLYGGHYGLGTARILAKILLNHEESIGINGIRVADFENVYNKFMQEK